MEHANSLRNFRSGTHLQQPQLSYETCNPDSLILSERQHSPSLLQHILVSKENTKFSLYHGGDKTTTVAGRGGDSEGDDCIILDLSNSTIKNKPIDHEILYANSNNDTSKMPKDDSDGSEGLPEDILAIVESLEIEREEREAAANSIPPMPKLIPIHPDLLNPPSTSSSSSSTIIDSETMVTSDFINDFSPISTPMSPKSRVIEVTNYTELTVTTTQHPLENMYLQLKSPAQLLLRTISPYKSDEENVAPKNSENQNAQNSQSSQNSQKSQKQQKSQQKPKKPKKPMDSLKSVPQSIMKHKDEDETSTNNEIEPNIIYCEAAGCGQPFYSKAALKLHERNHIDSLIMCPICNGISDRSVVETRLAKHHHNTKTRRRTFQCEVAGCNKVMANIVDLTIHKELHLAYDLGLCNEIVID